MKIAFTALFCLCLMSFARAQDADGMYSQRSKQKKINYSSLTPTQKAGVSLEKASGRLAGGIALMLVGSALAVYGGNENKKEFQYAGAAVGVIGFGINLSGIFRIGQAGAELRRIEL
jgi:hypothetical protein